MNLLNDLEYTPSNMMAFVEAHVFKYADRDNLFFQCQIELCVDAVGGCVTTVGATVTVTRARSTYCSHPYARIHRRHVVDDGSRRADRLCVSFCRDSTPTAAPSTSSRRRSVRQLIKQSIEQVNVYDAEELGLGHLTGEQITKEIIMSSLVDREMMEVWCPRMIRENL